MLPECQKYPQTNAIDGGKPEINVNAVDSSEYPGTLSASGKTPLQLACKNGHERIMNNLATEDAHTDITTKTKTLLHIACSARKVEAARLIITEGWVDVNARPDSTTRPSFRRMLPYENSGCGRKGRCDGQG